MSTQNFDQVEFYKKFYKIWENTLDEAFNIWSKSPMMKNTETTGKKETLQPDEYFKKFFKNWEGNMSETLESWMKTPFFTAAIGKGIEKSSEIKKYVDQIMVRSLKTMQLPTKGDIDKALTAINKIEEKVNDLLDQVEEIKASSVKK